MEGTLDSNECIQKVRFRVIGAALLQLGGAMLLEFDVVTAEDIHPSLSYDNRNTRSSTVVLPMPLITMREPLRLHVCIQYNILYVCCAATISVKIIWHLTKLTAGVLACNY